MIAALWLFGVGGLRWIAGRRDWFAPQFGVLLLLWSVTCFTFWAATYTGPA